MKLAIAFLLLIASPAAHASSPEIDQSLATLKTALSFADIEPRDKQRLQAIESQLENAIAKGSCGNASAQSTPYIAVCRALGTATGEQRGIGEASSLTNMEAAIANAKDKALENCKDTAVYKSDCEYIRAADNFQCHPK
ncbi:MAG: hypothetical protein ACXWQO_07645 [Bdellovibrionota bacterium]